MNFVLFYHSLVSDWNHGNAHFLRGVVTELLAKGHTVTTYEPADSWSKANLVKDHGEQPLKEFSQHYPNLSSIQYDKNSLDLTQATDNADVVIVHEWNEDWLVNGLGKVRKTNPAFRLLFHDTHHRAISDPNGIKAFELEYYDGILAFGEVLSEVYRQHGWHNQVWTWHEAADTNVFYPHQPSDDIVKGDVVWVGNWGDNERTQTLQEFLFQPTQELKLTTNIFGVRYPPEVLTKLKAWEIKYHGWLANFRAPDVFANHRMTVHIPRKFYTEQLPGIPTIRPFEAMACGIPLICAPWEDAENLFTPGEDYLVVKNGDQMQKAMQALLNDDDYAAEMAQHALNTILSGHTCAHRVDQLLKICNSMDVKPRSLSTPRDSQLLTQETYL
ncbi:glycosyltransferase [Alteromonas pelagimontana]|uniref:Glycosyltransferase n=1 Tax=Alteromonas pelagimontana TaxID=1858656 RepID=A0A6M4MCL8_9ALTE|nr:glycosyltransferase [Alteromonas pelagimontana]QJR80588.1 glycosyltransferase [Alteromonas pelagimontana]